MNDEDPVAGRTPGLGRPELLRVLESAASLQEVVPDAVLVGGSAAALWADPRPADSRTINQLRQYKGLDARWTDWKNVTDVCRSVAVKMVPSAALMVRMRRRSVRADAGVARRTARR